MKKSVIQFGLMEWIKRQVSGITYALKQPFVITNPPVAPITVSNTNDKPLSRIGQPRS